MMQLNDATLFGRSRPLPAAATHTATHPFLVDTPATESRQETPARRQRGGATRGTPEYDAWAQSIEEMIGTGAVEALQELLGSHGLGHLSGPDQIRVQVAQGPDGGQVMVIDPSPAAAAAQSHAAAQRTHVRGGEAVPPPRTTRQLTDRINSTAEFLPITTVQRWQEEARITAGSVLAAERIARLVNHVINVLHPPARLLAQEAKDAEQKAKDAREVEERRAAEVRQEEIATAATVAAGAESMEVVPTALKADAPPAVASQTVEDAAEAMEGVTMQDDLAEVMSLARSLAAGLAGFTGSPAATTTPATPVPAVQAPASEPQQEEEEPRDEMDDDDEDDDEGDEGPEASGSGAQERVTIFIHGNEVDITDTGIDPTFLEALPDDMREEVLNQHFRESRTSAPAPAVPSQINSEFLDALPPDLRAEVLRQEAAEQRREQAVARAAARDAGADVEAEAGPADIDPADFLASLDPQLRQAVLLEQEDGFLSTLPANLVAEANDLRQQGNARRAARQAANPPPPTFPQAAPGATPKKPVHREAIQLLDKSGLATLVRLLFFPQPLRKNALQKVLVNLCENSRTRTELINLLLTILQDGTRDVSAVDKSFSQMSLRASKHLGGAKDTPRRKVGAETPGGGLPHFPGESVPNLIAQRCLEALMFLVSSNDQAPLFFLTEQEVVVGLNRRSSKKGKGKEKATPSTTYPIIVLLSLLDRPALLKTQAMMDSLTQLLSTITKALAVLQRKASDTEAARDAPPASGEAPPPTTADPAVIDPTAAAAPAADTASSAAPATATATVATDAPKDAEKTEQTPGDVLLKDPPHISPSILRLVVNILDAGECSSKTFQQTLVLIQNLSYLPEAREVISEELKARAQTLSNQLLPDLDELLAAVQCTEDVRGVTLAKFSPASSLQAKLLRVLKTIGALFCSQPCRLQSDVRSTRRLDPLPSEEDEPTRRPFDGAQAFAGGGEGQPDLRELRLCRTVAAPR